MSLTVLVGAIVLAACDSGVDSGGLSLGERNAAQDAMNALQGSNIPTQLVSLSNTAGLPPAACRVHLMSKNPARFMVYVFWVPFVGPQSYTWLDMIIAKNAAADKFHLGAEAATIPSGVTIRGHTVIPTGQNYDPLSMGGSRQERRNKAVLMAHAGDAFSKPGANCQVLMNGYLRLLPNS